jgi:hypothetical protein
MDGDGSHSPRRAKLRLKGEGIVRKGREGKGCEGPDRIWVVIVVCWQAAVGKLRRGGRGGLKGVLMQLQLLLPNAPLVCA